MSRYGVTRILRSTHPTSATELNVGSIDLMQSWIISQAQ